MTNLEIAQRSPMRPIEEIAGKLNLTSEDYSQHGPYIAKLKLSRTLELLQRPKKGKLVLVTAVTPTPPGEGKTTVSVGLTQGLTKIGKKAIAAIREPALGPIFGVKGGACGGGYSQVLPMEEINLFFTGDFPAITAAHNLLSAAIDANLHHELDPHLDLRNVWWPRTVDMVDRALREIIVGLGNLNGPVRPSGFVITPASEVMASLCLSTSLENLKERLGRIVIGEKMDENPATCADLRVAGSMASLMREAVRPNLVQTIEGCPAFVHGGPFGNIAHGCSSLIATKTALALGDFVVTEGGFGSDLGGEKFLNIVSRSLGYGPDAIVLVATVRALKFHGSGDLALGCANLKQHISHLLNYGPPVIVGVNRFKDDTAEELEFVANAARAEGVQAVICDPWMSGGDGCTELGFLVASAVEEECTFKQIYDLEDTFEEKLGKLITKVYGGADFKLTVKAKRSLRWLREKGFDHLPICMAKTQSSLSEDPKKLGAPKDFTMTVKNINLSAGAGFLVVVCGDIMLMPGMGAAPAAFNIDVNAEGVISGLN